MVLGNLFFLVSIWTQPPGYESFFDPETKPFKNTEKIFFERLFMLLGSQERNRVDFNGETLTFTSMKMKIKVKTWLVSDISRSVKNGRSRSVKTSIMYVRTSFLESRNVFDTMFRRL